MARLLDSLREAGAQEQATALADRAAAHVSLDNPDAVARLLGSLREAGAQEQATALADRLPADGEFDLFQRVNGTQSQFGREPDGDRPRLGTGPTWTDQSCASRIKRSALCGPPGEVRITAAPELDEIAQGKVCAGADGAALWAGHLDPAAGDNRWHGPAG